MAWEGPSRFLALDQLCTASCPQILVLPSPLVCLHEQEHARCLSATLWQAQLPQEQDLLEFSGAGQQNS